jgi:hypothetical protein
LKVVPALTLANILLGIPGIIPGISLGYFFSGEIKLQFILLFVISMLIWLFINFMIIRNKSNKLSYFIYGFVLFATSSGVAVGVFFVLALSTFIPI